MDCKDIKQIIPKYFKHTATDDEIKTVEEHLCICHDCRTALGELMDKVSDLEDSQSQKPDSQEKPESKAKKKQQGPSEDKTKEEPQDSGAEEMEYFPGVDIESAMSKLKETPVGEEKEERDELLDEVEKEEKPEYYTFDEEPKPEPQEDSQKQDEDKAKAAKDQEAESAQEEKAEQSRGGSDTLSLDALKSSLDSKEQASEQEEEKPVAEREPLDEVRPDYVIEDEQPQPSEQNEPSPKEDKAVTPADSFKPQAKDETLEPAAERAGADECKEPKTASEKQENIPSQREELKPSYDSKKRPTYSLDGVPIGKGKARSLEYICLIAGIAILGFFIFLLIKG